MEAAYKTGLDRVLRETLERAREREGYAVYPAVKIGNSIYTLIREGDKLTIAEKKGVECGLARGEHDDVCREVLRAACVGPEHVGWKLGDLERRLARGGLFGEILAQRHPTVLWAKELDRYVAVGISDGIGEDFVYEFKSTRMSYGGLRRYVLPVAMAHANIYAWFFKRQRWVVVIFSCEDLKLYRW